MKQMTASVQLIEALGAGWDSSQRPSQKELVAQAVQSKTLTQRPEGDHTSQWQTSAGKSNTAHNCNNSAHFIKTPLLVVAICACCSR
jgi:hypothetical protein